MEDDRVRVTRAVPVDVLDRISERIHHSHSHLQPVVLRVPIGIGRLVHPHLARALASPLIAHQLHPGLAQLGQQAREQVVVRDVGC